MGGFSSSIQTPKPVGSTSGAKAQNAEWFAADLSPRYAASKFRVHLAISLANIIEYSLDSGTTWVAFNAGAALTVDDGYQFDVPTRSGDLFQMRDPTVGGSTVRYCRVDEVIGEG